MEQPPPPLELYTLILCSPALALARDLATSAFTSYKREAGQIKSQSLGANKIQKKTNALYY
jgi:hypothetical protein